MNKAELTAKYLRDALGAHRVVQRWHNKNKSGGNFGINIYFAEEFNRETDREITGEYDPTGQLRHLSYGALYGGGFAIPPERFEDSAAFALLLKRFVAFERAKNEASNALDSTNTPSGEPEEVAP